MALSLRFQYPGVVCHVVARGNWGDAVFETDDDRKAFLSRLGESSECQCWRIDAWVLMSKPFHLPLGSPLANPVARMKWPLDTSSQGRNRGRQRRGQVFQAGGKRGSLGADPWSRPAVKLATRHPGGLSRLVSLGKVEREALEEVAKPGELLIRED